MKIKYLLLIILIPYGIFAQTTFIKTISISEADSISSATIEEVSWISGHWTGEAFGGITEEIWTPPLGNSMMCAFKLVNEDSIVFYELCTISEKEGTLILRLKHFHEDLKGWEEKDEVQEFPLVKLGKNIAFFDGFTFEKVDDEHLNIYVRISEGEKIEEVPFYYSKAKE